MRTMKARRRKLTNSGERIGIIGILMNLIISIPKIILGISSKSISLFTDGINNACDSLTGFITYIGIRLSKKPIDQDHPYGHARAEYIAGFVIAIFTGIVGLKFFKSAVQALMNPKTPDVDTIGRAFLVLSITLKAGFVYLNHREYKIHHATIFMANRQDSLMDIIISTFILVSSFFFASHEWLDACIGLLISILILHQAYETLKETLIPLVGPTPSSRDLDTITAALEKSDLIKNVHDLYVDRQSMGKVIATADVEVDPMLTVKEVHDEVEMISKDLRQKANIDLVIHVEPLIQDSKLLHLKRCLKNIDGVDGVYDLIMKEENYVTLAIDEHNLNSEDQIKSEALKILNKEDGKKWNIETIVGFQKN